MKKFIGMRRFFALALALCLVGPLVPKASAATADAGDTPIKPYYIGTVSISASIAPDPKATHERPTVVCTGHVDCYPGYTAKAVMRLQWQDKDGVWMDYKNWYKNGDIITFGETYSVPTGYKYRVRVVADIYDNATEKRVESVTAISGALYHK